MNSFQVYATRRQMRRYLDFFESAQPEWELVVRLAMDLFDVLTVPQQPS